MLYVIYGLIIIITIILYFQVKDKKEFINKLGKIMITSGIILLFLGLTINILLNTSLNNFNITKISLLLFKKFIYNSIILLVIGLIELLISKIINKCRTKVSS